MCCDGRGSTIPPAAASRSPLLRSCCHTPHQRSGLPPQPVDQVLQVDRPGPPVPFLFIAMDPHQLAGDLTTKQHLQSDVEDPHLHPRPGRPGSRPPSRTRCCRAAAEPARCTPTPSEKPSAGGNHGVSPPGRSHGPRRHGCGCRPARGGC